jgi:hypothetical protein
MSVSRPPSPGTSSDDIESNATNRPSALIAIANVE